MPLRRIVRRTLPRGVKPNGQRRLLAPPLLDAKPPLTTRDYMSVTGRIEAIRDECRLQGLRLLSQQAYVLATAEHETGGTYAPVREGFYLGAKAEAFRRRLRYYPYYGRGLVQLTWRANYAKYADILQLDLVNQPDLALNPAVATFILVHGMRQGVFTGRALGDYVNDQQTDFLNARRVINGTDRATRIARLANAHLLALRGTHSRITAA